MYQSFLNSLSGRCWKRIGLKRRSGAAVPLFSIYSKKSAGVGELPDLKLLIDWCRKTGMSLLQFLPLNDTGFHFRPYDAQSGFALEPMYLSFDHFAEVDPKPFRDEIESLRKRFPPGGGRVDYGIKAQKLQLLWNLFEKEVKRNSRSFTRFREANRFWLRDYSIFKVIKEENSQKSWEEWAPGLRERQDETLGDFERTHEEKIKFHEWLQYELYLQLSEVRKYARRKKVFLIGDLPFLASRDSADVWAHREYFKLDFSSGAPPDAYFFKGQRWGMPPCDWEKMEERGYDYLIQRLKYAGHFYDGLRIDHAVGLFRLWTIPLSEPVEDGGLNGVFDPRNERIWEEHGRKLWSTVIRNTSLLILAEDLGTVPECSHRVLEEFGVAGVDVQRWMRDPGKDYAFKAPEEYRKNSIATLSTHDVAPFDAWWEYEAGTVYGPLFKRKCEAKGIDFEQVKIKLFDLERSFYDRLRWKVEISDAGILVQALGRPANELADLVNLYRYSYGEKEKFWTYLGFACPCEEKSSPELAKAALKKLAGARSVLSIPLLQDWLSIGNVFQGDSWTRRINFPGITSEKNWSWAMPLSLEEMKGLSVNREIKAVNTQAGRI